MSTAEPFLAELFQTHRSGLAGAVRSVLGPSTDVTEVLQEAFLKCWRAWQQGTRPKDPVAWMFVITWNAATDARRVRQRRPNHEPLDEERTVSVTTQPSPSHALEQREAVAQAQAAVARLREDDQQVFLLRVAGELSYEGVAEALAIPVGTAKTRMRRALQQLRSALGASVPFGGIAGGSIPGGNVSGGNVSGSNVSGSNVTGNQIPGGITSKENLR